MVETAQVFGRHRCQIETCDLTVVAASEVWKGHCLPQSEDAQGERDPLHHFLGTEHIPGRVCSQRHYLWNKRTQLACCVSLNSAEMVTEGVSEIVGNLIVSDRTNN